MLESVRDSIQLNLKANLKISLHIGLLQSLSTHFHSVIEDLLFQPPKLCKFLQS